MHEATPLQDGERIGPFRVIGHFQHERLAPRLRHNVLAPLSDGGGSPPPRNRSEHLLKTAPPRSPAGVPWERPSLRPISPSPGRRRPIQRRVNRAATRV